MSAKLTPHLAKDFVFGVATSSYQIEGAVHADGRGPSIWDTFCAQPGAIDDRSSGYAACDHYHRWPEDVAIMREIGVDAYRFSIAWPRIQATGEGPANPRGLDFYDKLVDGLLKAGIEPFVTLYHWDLPQALQDKGGWPARGTVEAFVHYADIVSRRLGDRVKKWITHNEPWCVAHLGYWEGRHAPGIKSMPAMLAAAHHVLLSHGASVPVLRANAPGAQVGLALNLVPAMPASPSAADREACRRFDGMFNRWYLDPLYRSSYPADLVEQYIAEGHLKADPSFIGPNDMATIAAPTDFLGINYYSRAVIRSDAIPESENLPRTIPVAPSERCTDMGWEVYAPGLYDLLDRVHRDYRPAKFYITENGAAYSTVPDDQGRVADAQRTTYLAEHIAEVDRAAAAGVPMAGYFVWSLLDNFEWSFGYAKRFGIVWVDYHTQERKLKDSARWYRELIARHGA